MEALHPHGHDALAVFHRIRRDRPERLRVDQADEVRRRRHDFSVNHNGEVLVLEFYAGLMTLALADSVEHGLAEVETGACLAQNV